MVSRALKAMAGLLAITMLCPVLASAGEETYEGCKLTTDNSGRITAMTYSNPETYLGIESGFQFSVSADGRATGGTINFKNGFQRQMNNGEASLYFAKCGGPNTVWDYSRDHGKTVSYVIGNDKVPNEVFGKTCRLISPEGKEYIGKLAKSSNGDGFSLAVDGASGGPLLFTGNTVKEIQEMK